MIRLCVVAVSVKHSFPKRIVGVPPIPTGQFLANSRQMRSVSVAWRHSEQRETNEMDGKNLGVKQALFRLSYDPVNNINIIYNLSRFKSSAMTTPKADGSVHWAPSQPDNTFMFYVLSIRVKKR
jgi:hypothetical protein